VRAGKFRRIARFARGQARSLAVLAACGALFLALSACGGGRKGRSNADRFVVREACPPAPPRFSPPAPPGTVVVTGRPGQVMDGWGASVVGDTVVEPLVDPVGLRPGQLRALDRLVFRVAGIDLVRVFGPGFGHAAVSASSRDRVRDRSFAFMRRAQPYGVRFMYTGARAPDALQDGNRLRPGAEAAYGRSVAAYLRFSRDVLGLPFAYAAIANEPDNEASRLVMTPAQSARVYGALAGALGAAGEQTRLVLGDTTGWGTACPYLMAQLASRPARAAAAAAASHPYFGTGAQAAALAADAGRAGLRVWQTEWGTGCPRCGEDDSMHLAIRWSQRIATDLDRGRVSAWFAFRAVADSTHGPGDALIVRTRGSPRRPWLVTRRFDVFRQYSSVGPRGARRLLVGERITGLFAVAFRNAGRTSVVLTNTSRRSARKPLLDLGPRAGDLTARRTSSRERFAPVAAPRYRGRPVRVTLPPESVTTYTLARG
jgi:hypothetical protein